MSKTHAQIKKARNRFDQEAREPGERPMTAQEWERLGDIAEATAETYPLGSDLRRYHHSLSAKCWSRAGLLRAGVVIP